MRHATLSVILLALAPSGVVAGGQPEQPVTAALSAETRTVLIREMQAMAEAMGRIHRAVVTGDHATVATEARNIHDSFILARELTDVQRKEIGAKLPPAFVQQDQAFHGLAGQLAQAGEREDPRLERLWFEEMTRACQACHAEYAAGRFPGLGDLNAGNHE